MESQLMWVLVVQLLVLVAVAVCILLFMLKKLVGSAHVPSNSKTILVTAADTPIGSQIATHLSSMGFRVFAGVADEKSSSAQALKRSPSPWLHLLPLDVTNDNSLASALNQVNTHLHAGEKGLWAVIHLAGTGTHQTKEKQDEDQLRRALEVTVVGLLRLVRATLPLLAPTKGRLIMLGADDEMSMGLRVWGGGADSVTHGVWTAARFAAEGLAAGLRAQLRPHGVSLVSLHPDAYVAQRLNETEESRKMLVVDMENEILSSYAMSAVEDSVLRGIPEETYVLTPSPSARIQRLLFALSPGCVSRAILKPHKQFQDHPHTIAQTPLTLVV